MTWTRIGDDFNDSPAMLALTPSAQLLHVQGLVYGNRHLTDGAIPAAALRTFAKGADPERDAAELVKAGLWTATATGWEIDWSDQEPGEQVAARKARNAARQTRYRERQNRHQAGDHSQCDGKFCAAARQRKGVTRDVTGDVTRDAAESRENRDTSGQNDSVTRDVSGDVTRDETATRPDPTRPVPKGQGSGVGERKEKTGEGGQRTDGSGADAPDRRPPSHNSENDETDDVGIPRLNPIRKATRSGNTVHTGISFTFGEP
jgi:hypothetical protein